MITEAPAARLPGASPVPGPVLFARYAFGPNRLGYCGTDDHAAVLSHTLAGEERPLRGLARTFDGAYPYLELIAGSNGIGDPLDPRVVEAYWLGNELSRQVTRRGLHRSIDDRFRKRLSSDAWGWLSATVAADARPVHAYHVLDVFPRVGLLRGGDGDDALQVMNACRISWGTVREADDAGLLVDVAPLEMVEGRLRIGAPRLERVETWQDGDGMSDRPRPGEMVAVHWGWAADRLSPRQLRNLQAWTRFELAVANRAI